eukprot:CAMPEP_0201517834 /NCGR_PEP_ID=MMETSP0161_2-20130828/8845_1 /ASSEMBLY_ACC=CAM_ASM_000251 /TAXON_ID=180227 /ORGANISM="Neoparamoeba aestuarina, Strain SoJaBio B1-5/56/2" /LENGTH=249 /DNA_ID=CAMNT_0047915455 /DNA_START=37 /DNA_END=786 /DNA_ORIENTATION=+
MRDQTVLELLIAQMREADALKNTDGDFVPIESWDGIEFHDCGSVKSITWQYNQQNNYYFYQPGGSIELRWLPLKCTQVRITNLQLHGKLDTGDLPPDLEVLLLSMNCLSGTFSIDHLPREVRNVQIFSNNFAGSLDLQNMPRTMFYFDASFNTFSGKLHFTNLPDSLEILRLEDNRFSGEVSMRSLPIKLLRVYINANEVSQDKLIIDNRINRRIEIDHNAFATIEMTDGRKPLRIQRQSGRKSVFVGP